ncbi:piercer of microtubule wall 2 protein [Syngnathus scovelli]|uniref:piercer of microtubule wall 2 protein n=1 Tax=Syngnathus scovelli TaxID=161590 RepID=UPI00210F81C4|nr:piercer of microtubule wall 2 protein [Syngnathus scovelli]
MVAMETRQDCEQAKKDDACLEDSLLNAGASAMSAPAKEEPEKTQACVNFGNPVFTCTTTPSFKGVTQSRWSQRQNPLYRTTSADYGLYPPTVETTPCTYHPKSQKFTNLLGKTGMYRDDCFNTALDRSRVYDCPNLQHTI